MAEVKIYINGRTYDISCDSGQEGRIVDLAAFIDQKLQQISRSGGAYNDAHLMVLTALMLADEMFDMREALNAPKPARVAPQKSVPSKEDEQAMVRVIEYLTDRIDGIASRLQQAS